MGYAKGQRGVKAVQGVGVVVARGKRLSLWKQTRSERAQLISWGIHNWCAIAIAKATAGRIDGKEPRDRINVNSDSSVKTIFSTHS